jgi:hypothetical protein
LLFVLGLELFGILGGCGGFGSGEILFRHARGWKI